MRPAVKAGCRWARDRSRARTLRNGVYLAEERRPLTVYDSVPGVGEVAVAVGVDGDSGSTAARCLHRDFGVVGADDRELAGIRRKAFQIPQWQVRADCDGAREADVVIAKIISKRVPRSRADRGGHDIEGSDARHGLVVCKAQVGTADRGCGKGFGRNVASGRVVPLSLIHL